MTEKEFQSQVVGIAKMLGWFTYHTHRSDRSEPGFPDLCMVRGSRVIFVELKVGKGRVTGSQRSWLSRLAITGRVEVYLWRPVHLTHIVHMLSKQEVIPALTGGYGKFTADQIGRWDPS